MGSGAHGLIIIEDDPDIPIPDTILEMDQETVVFSHFDSAFFAKVAAGAEDELFVPYPDSADPTRVYVPLRTRRRTSNASLYRSEGTQVFASNRSGPESLA